MHLLLAATPYTEPRAKGQRMQAGSPALARCLQGNGGTKKTGRPRHARPEHTQRRAQSTTRGRASELDVDLGQDALAVRRAAQGGQVRADGLYERQVQRAGRHAQRALQHVVGVRVLPATHARAQSVTWYREHTAVTWQT